MDADGWVYAVDFPWLKMPPLPGMGRKCAQCSCLLHHQIYEAVTMLLASSSLCFVLASQSQV